MSKFTIYQVLPRLFGNDNTTCKHNGTIEENGCGKFNDFTTKALSEIKDLGITHIWYTGIIEHATQTDYTQYGIRKDHPAVVKGIAGSPYAIKDYYDVDPDLAVDVPNRMTEFENLVTRTHEAGMKVIIDFIPNHVAREYNPDWHFSPLNNFYYIPGRKFSPHFDIEDYEEYPAKATGNDKFTASPTINDWYETVKLNYGVNYVEGKQQQFSPTPDTWYKMRDILLFWAGKNVDGFRCDMAEMVPVEFWGWVIPQIKKQSPALIFIAEVYNKAEYRNFIANAKFDYLYDKVGLYDTLRDVTSKNYPVRDITYCWQALSGIEDRMLNFLENHDEQRIASGFFSGSGIYAEPAMTVAATLTKAPMMIYSGQELGELGMDYEGFSGVDGRTSIFDYWGVKSIQSWRNKGKFDGKKLKPEQKYIRDFYKKLLNITINEKAVKDGLMYDLEYANFNNHKFNSHEQFAYFRKKDKELILFVLNFHDKHLDTDVNIPIEAFTYLNIDENRTYSYVDLLEDKSETYTAELSSQKPFTIKIDAWKARILKFSYE